MSKSFTFRYFTRNSFGQNVCTIISVSAHSESEAVKLIKNKDWSGNPDIQKIIQKNPIPDAEELR